jgi:DNA invertase Pin-like site-specific DNA recombinase
MTTKGALAYYRTSSVSNVGADKDSLKRQQAAVHAYAAAHGIEVAEEFYDPAVSGADAVDQRPGFSALLARLALNGVRVVLVEDVTRFARDLAVQLTGHAMLQKLGVELIPVNAPDYFTDETPTAVLVRQVLGAIAQFEKAQLVHKLKVARDRKRAETGRCGGNQPVPTETVAAARRLAIAPAGHKPRSLRTVATLLAAEGHLRKGKPYSHEAVRQMLARAE